MSVLAAALACGLAVTTAGCGQKLRPSPGGDAEHDDGEAHPPVHAPYHRGVSWVAGRGVQPGDLETAARHHIDWIVQTPFGWQEAIDEPEIRLITEGHILWGETDEGLVTTARLARMNGIRTMIKPHVWVEAKWRGDIAMSSAQEWDRWWSDYRTFMLHYARLAAANGFEGICIGTELYSTVVPFEKRWRDLISEIRAFYPGHMTYAANWYREVEDVPFWDELDSIGVQAYFPLSEEDDPHLDELIRAWQPHLDAIETVHLSTGKPVLFTEIGYRSVPAATREPWTWPQFSGERRSDLDLQARSYEAFFRSAWKRPWMAGSYFWKWYPRHPAPEGRFLLDFTPQNKPAGEVMSRWYAEAADPNRDPGT